MQAIPSFIHSCNYEEPCFKWGWERIRFNGLSENEVVYPERFNELYSAI